MRRKGKPPLFGGLMTALVTPFRGEMIDFNALEELVEWQINQGVQGIVACGTTAEAPTLSREERADVIRLCIQVARGRVPIVVGTGTNDTRSTVELTAEAARLGAGGALVVTPYYNRPNPEGLFRHFESVGRSASIPVIIYNVPSRTSVDIGIDTLERLASLPGIVAIKDSTGDLARVREMVARLGNRFTHLSGQDCSMAAFMAAGGEGAISVVSNVAPSMSAALIAAFLRKDHVAGWRIHARLQPLLSALELECNPAPVKYALHCARGYAPSLRLPLVEVTPATAATIREAVAITSGPTMVSSAVTSSGAGLRLRSA